MTLDSDLTGASIYLFLDRRTPILAAAACVTVLVQVQMMYVFWWAAQEDNKDGDYVFGYEPKCGSTSAPPTCSSIKQASGMAITSVIVINLLVQGPDIPRGCRLLRRRK